MTWPAISELRDHYSQFPALLLGNGKSRLGFDLGLVRKGIATFGCNALYRDFSPDFLLSMDEKMIVEILSSGYTDVHTLLCPPPDLAAALRSMKREFETFENLRTLDLVGFGSSGNTSCYVAAILGFDPIYLLGFDGDAIDEGGAPNNVYFNTPNYKTVYSPAASVKQKEVFVQGFEKALEESGKSPTVISIESCPYPCERVSVTEMSELLYAKRGARGRRAS